MIFWRREFAFLPTVLIPKSSAMTRGPTSPKRRETATAFVTLCDCIELQYSQSFFCRKSQVVLHTVAYHRSIADIYHTMADLADRSKAAGQDADMTQVAANEQAGKKEKSKKTPKEKQPQGQGKRKGGEAAGDTKGITVKKEEDLSAWYQEVLLKGDFLEYSDVPGCYIYNVSLLICHCWQCSCGC